MNEYHKLLRLMNKIGIIKKNYTGTSGYDQFEIPFTDTYPRPHVKELARLRRIIKPKDMWVDNHDNCIYLRFKRGL